MLNYIILAAVSLVISSIGFRYYVHFFSVGYGFGISGLSLAMFILYFTGLSPVTIIISALLFVYGLRLGGYLLYREIKMPSYGKHVSGDIKDGSKVSVFAKICIWLSCAILYLLMTSPLLFRLEMGKALGFGGCAIAGLVLMVLGILMEVTADKQKSDAKKKNPGTFVKTGLYRFVRCPNYLGELLLWTGVFVSGIPAYHGWQWIAAISGLVLIYYVMFSGARRLELRQIKTYGSDSEFQKYSKSVPIIVPFIPLYSVVKFKFLVA